MTFKDTIQPVLDFFDRIFGKVFPLLSPVSSEVSAALLALIVIGMLGLLAYFFFIIDRVVRPRRRPPSEDESGEDTPDEEVEGIQGSGRLAQCRRQLQSARAKLKLLETNPQYETIERVYFAVNGITNSGLILSSSLLLYEFFKNNGKPSSNVVAVSTEIGHVIGVVAFTLLVSAIVVYMSGPSRGHSWERINRAFAISFAICVAAFGVFVTFISPW